jgi:hypothetical protein
VEGLWGVSEQTGLNRSWQLPAITDDYLKQQKLSTLDGKRVICD